MNINNTAIGSSPLNISSYAQTKRPEEMSISKNIKEEEPRRINEGLDMSRVKIQLMQEPDNNYIDTNDPTKSVESDHPNALHYTIYAGLKASGETSTALKISTEEFSEILQSIEDTKPGLLNKDWGFSINENNEIEILEGSSLTSDEIDYLEEKLAKLNENNEFSNLADAIVKDSEADANMGASELGRYDISRENISKMDFREVLTERNYTHDAGRLQHQADISLKDDLRVFEKIDVVTIDIKV